MTTFISLIGILVLLAVAFLLSAAKSKINWRTVGLAFALQFGFGALALYLPAGRVALESISAAVTNVVSYGQLGVDFMFGELGQFKLGFIFAFHVLPIVIFFSSLVAVLYYLGVMGWTIRVLGGALRKLLGTSRAESMSATANIFVSQTEAPMVIRPFVASMTRSEIFAVMVGGMATVAGSVL
ncbi:MAG: Na+ dependent nucleoside transporter N-terminal domain-containing protein, partial [Pseudomonadota bacterium]